MSKSRESVSPARSAAFDILERVEAEKAYASVLLAALSESNLAREDRTLVREIVLGSLRWQLSLDTLIERYAGRPTRRLDPSVLIALRIGLYQLRYLNRIPQSAAVNESVKLVKRASTSSAVPFVNAVLRKAARLANEPVCAGAANSGELNELELSHPRWMLERWSKSYGVSETRLLALANNSAAKIAFRVNTLRESSEEVLEKLAGIGLSIRESRVSAGAYVVDSGPMPAIMDAASEGKIYIQDEASQLVSLLMSPQSGQRILDLCAAPGSKTSHIALLTGDKSSIVSCDLYHHRLKTVLAACERLGIESVGAVMLDATQSLPFVPGADLFDRVLVDAPCSGTGTLRGNPEIKWRLKKEDIVRLADLQLGLLKRASTVVATGGRMVYSTCSLEREEDEEVIGRFLAEDNSFELMTPGAAPDLVTSEKYVRTYPHRDGTDGFFVAILERRR